jgi:hypothetical protein
MKLDASRTFGNATYVLSDREIAALMADVRLDADAASPLKTVNRSILAKTLPPEAGEVKDALKVLCRPRTKIGLRTWPDASDWLWFYGAADVSQNFSLYSKNQETGANMIMWPVAPTVLKSMAAAPLGGIVPAEATSADFSVSFSEFLVLASLVDCQQEIVLRSLADRSGAPDIHFTPEAVETAYSKGLKDGSDPRWMVSRLAMGLDTELPAKLAGAQTALDRLCGIGMLAKDNNSYKPSPSSELIFHQLASIEGLAAVIIEDKASGSNTVRRIYQSSRWQLWRYAFDEGLGTDARVQVSNISSSGLSDELNQFIATSMAAPKAAQATAETSACPSCGSEVTPGQKFCPECGTKLGAAPPTPQTPPPLKRCPQCGAELGPDLKFCTECGFPVMAF